MHDGGGGSFGGGHHGGFTGGNIGGHSGGHHGEVSGGHHGGLSGGHHGGHHRQQDNSPYLVDGTVLGGTNRRDRDVSRFRRGRPQKAANRVVRLILMLGFIAFFIIVAWSIASGMHG
jgi:hypothetical protein